MLVLKRWGWKFNTSALAKMMFPCIQNWTLAYTVLAKCLGQFRNDNSIDLQDGRKYKTEQELSSFPQLWVFASTATAHSIYNVWMKHICQLVQNLTALRMSTTGDYSLSFSMPVHWTWTVPVQINSGVLIHLPMPHQHSFTLLKLRHYKDSDAWHYSINQMLPVFLPLVLEKD